jgi:hypothetical protein
MSSIVHSTASPSLPARALGAFSRALSFSDSPSKIRGWRFVAMISAAGFLLFAMAYQGYLAKAFRSVGDEGAATVALAQSGLSSLAGAHAAVLRFSVGADAKEAQAADRQAALARRFLMRAAADAGHSPTAMRLAEEAMEAQAAWDGAWERQRLAPSPARAQALQTAYDQATLGFARLTENGAARMEAAYKAHPNNAWFAALGCALCALATAFALIKLQLEMLRASNRALNAGALVATFAFCAFFAIGGFVAVSAESSLRSSKTEAFGSSVTLWAAKASLQEARGLRAKIAANPTAPELGEDWERLATGILAQTDLTTPYLPSKVDAAGARIGGLLGRALEESSYPGEREALRRGADAWALYAASFNDANKGIAAMGDEKAFADALAGVDQALEANQRAFGAEISTSEARLALMPWLAFLLGLAGACGCYFGSKARLDEYRF